MSRKKVLVTGAYGLIGNVIYTRLSRNPDKYDVYGLSRRSLPSDRIPTSAVFSIPEDKFHLADLSDFEAIQKAVADMDVVVHMAADPSGSSGWESILASNITGAYHVFEACRLAGVKRIISASSIQVISGYRRDEPYRSVFSHHSDGMSATNVPPITHEQPARPTNLYACSKVWGEALAHTYANRHGMSCLCLRIGWVRAEDKPPNGSGKAQWCSQRDIAQLVERCVNAPESLRFDIFFGVSDNEFQMADIDHAREVLGYEPQDHTRDFGEDKADKD